MNKPALIIIVVLLAITAFGGYKFIIQGSTTTSVDGRITILMTDAEKDLILEEMRGFLAATQQIIAAVAADDLEKAAIAAKKVGRAAQAEVPGTLMGKLPIAFKKLGFDTHTKFDQLALDAESLEDGNYTLEQLSALMQNCVGCHSAYRLEVEKK